MYRRTRDKTTIEINLRLEAPITNKTAISETRSISSPSAISTSTKSLLMRVRTLEIRWHDGKPLCSCDFQPVAGPSKKARLSKDAALAPASYRLATGGEDNHVRVSRAILSKVIVDLIIYLVIIDVDGIPQFHSAHRRGERVDV